jgi:hypothetical protein
MTRRSRSKRCSAKVFRIDGVPEGVLMGCIASATLQLDSLREKAESLEAKEGAKFGLTSTPFRSLKTVDLELRPVFHWTALRVRAHVLLCIA